MKNISIWADNKYKEYGSLNENKDIDILIIGGGITGVSTLYNLDKTNYKTILVEQNRVGLSTTSKSTGKLTILQNDLIDQIKTNYNDKIASLYLKSQIIAINSIVEVIKKEQINCSIQEVKSYIYTNKDSEISKIKKLQTFLKENDIDSQVDKIDIVKSKYIISIPKSYIFNPLAFLHGLLDNIKSPIYENTCIKKIKKKKDYYECYTEKNIIKAKYVILASHYPFFTLPYFFPFKTSLEKSYLSASKYDIKPFSLISYKKPFISLRTYQDKLIYLSNTHIIDTNTCDKENFKELNKKLNDLNLKPDYLWSNIDIMTSDGLPIIGRLKGNIFLATGYNTWGLANGYLASLIIKDMLLNNENEFEKIFNPNRMLISLNKSFKSFKGFMKGLIKGTEYTCPHLACKLVYNEIEETFDCPCHGSRFDKDGNIISSPANKKIKIKKDC